MSEQVIIVPEKFDYGLVKITVLDVNDTLSDIIIARKDLVKNCSDVINVEILGINETNRYVEIYWKDEKGANRLVIPWERVASISYHENRELRCELDESNYV